MFNTFRKGLPTLLVQHMDSYCCILMLTLHLSDLQEKNDYKMDKASCI